MIKYKPIISELLLDIGLTILTEERIEGIESLGGGDGIEGSYARAYGFY